MDGDIDIDTRMDSPDFSRAPAGDPGAFQSLPSSTSYPPSDPPESDNETSYVFQPRQDPIQLVSGPDPQPGHTFPPGPVPPPPVPPPPPYVPLPGGERNHDPLTNSWPGTTHDPLVGSWDPSFDPLGDPWPAGASGASQPPSPVPPPGGPGMSMTGTTTYSVPGGPGPGGVPSSVQQPWSEPSAYGPHSDRGRYPGSHPAPPAWMPPPPQSPPPQSAPPQVPAPHLPGSAGFGPTQVDQRVSVVPFRHEERPDGAGRTPAPPAVPPPGRPLDARDTHNSGYNLVHEQTGYVSPVHPQAPDYHNDTQYPDDTRYPPDFDSADPLGVPRGTPDVTVGAPLQSEDHLSYPPISADYPAQAPSAQQPAGPATAALSLDQPGIPPLYRDNGRGYPDGQGPGPAFPGLPYSGGSQPGPPYPDNSYPSTEYPAPPPTGVLPAHTDAANGRPDGMRQPGGASNRLLTSALLPTPPDTASSGWRKVIFRASGGTINLGPSADEARHRRLVTHIRTPLYDCHRIAVMSLKGGVGKTTTTVALGSALASLRGDRVVAIDANPDRGTLGAKVPRTSANTVRDLLDNAGSLHRYVDVRRYLSQSDSRLEVLASANDPEISEAFADTDYLAVDDILQRHYSILLTDCGTGILHSAMPAVLKLADTLVIVSSSSADGGSSASATMDWLEAHGYAEQVREAVTVISTFPVNGESVDVAALEQHFAARTRRVVQVPYDPHLAIGGRIVLEDMRKPTRQAFLEIAGAVAERFGLESSRPTPAG